MNKSAWYYAKGRETGFAEDVAGMARCGVRTVILNSPDPATTRAFASLAARQRIDLHVALSLDELHHAALGKPTPRMVVPRLDEFTARFGERALPWMVCWSALEDAGPLAAWLVDFLRSHPFARGINIDILRYMNTVFWEDFPCQCEACCTRREPWLGHGLLTDEDRGDPSLMYLEIQTKGKVISRIARTLAEAVHGAGLPFSIAARAVYAGRDVEHAAAPMWGYGPAIYEGQDWAAWCREGILDTIHFMNYTPRLERFARLARQHRALLQGTRTVHHEGIGVASSAGVLPPEAMEQQIDVCRGVGIAGVTVFSWHGMTPAHQEVLAKA
jgi:hypothetical protein